MLGGMAQQLRVAGRLSVPVGLDEALEARRTFRARGLRTPSLRVCRQAFLSHVHLLPPDLDLRAGLVLDVGANEGNFSAAIKALSPASAVVAVEPGPAPRAALEARLGGTAGVTVVGAAVGATPGTATLHVTAHSHNASLQRPREEMVSLYGDQGWSVVEEIEVPVTTLDELSAGRDVAALKLDVQGGELDVLAGGAETLQRTAAVLIEVTFVSHYEGDATFGALHEALVGEGFALSGISDAGRTSEGLATWADACYARPGFLRRA